MCKEYRWVYKTVQKPASHDQTTKIDNIYSFNGDVRDPGPGETPIPRRFACSLSGRSDVKAV